MATRVSTRCPGCGPVLVAVEGCRVLITSDPDQGAHYTFVCSRCAVLVSLPASRNDVTVLVRGGVCTVMVPLEVLERAFLQDFAPLDAEELAVFVANLELTDDLSLVAEWEGEPRCQ